MGIAAQHPDLFPVEALIEKETGFLSADKINEKFEAVFFNGDRICFSIAQQKTVVILQAFQRA